MPKDNTAKAKKLPKTKSRNRLKNHLLIVESPHKAKTIAKFLRNLDGEYRVESSKGHIRDLPLHDLGVNIDNGFVLTYEISKGKSKVVSDLRSAVRDADVVYLASDPDREGEAISWHLQEVLKTAADGTPFKRVKYNEITPRAVIAALDNAGEIDMNLVDAQQARRAIDRIVGYTISPIVRRRIKGGSSAGRVQSVALRLVCEREEEIRAFNPLSYWVLGAMLQKRPDEPFFAKLAKLNGKKPEIGDGGEAKRIFEEMQSRKFVVEAVTRREVTRHALPPFITSSLQRAASSVLGMSPARTMSIAQTLYEGVDIGEAGGAVGLITYMRTDGAFVAREAQEATLDYITANYGKEFRPQRPNAYKSSNSAQEAHEAIRPTDISRTPKSLAKYLKADELKLYDLIWRRFVASQMAPAKFSQRTVLFDGERLDGAPLKRTEDAITLSATTTDVVFQGFMKVMSLDIKKALAMKDGKDEEIQQDDDEGDAHGAKVPLLDEGERVDTVEIKSQRKETKPPPRYSEAALIDVLEKNGVGRPSTYASIMETIVYHKYVAREGKALSPTPLGEDVAKFLVEKFPELFDVGFTARLEEELDKVADGSWGNGYFALMSDFYSKFKELLLNGKDPPAETAKVKTVLEALEDVKDWIPPEKRGRRTYDDRKLYISLKNQFETGEKPITTRQLDALVGISKRHRIQIANFEKRFDGIISPEDLRSKNPETSQEIYHKIEMLLESPAKSNFLSSIFSQLRSGRNLSLRQTAAVEKIFASSFRDIPGGVEKAAKYGIDVRNIQMPEPDNESGPLLAALAAVKRWDSPLAHKGRMLDDKTFYESVKRQFEEKGSLSEKQRAVLRRMGGHYASQIPASLLPKPPANIKPQVRDGKA